MKKYIRNFLLILSGVLLLGVLWQWQTVAYLWGQLSGGAQVILKAKPVSEILADESVADSTKNRLRFIEEIRRYAIDSLGLSNTPNYQTYYEQHGKPICYVLTVAEPYQLKAIDFSFPIIGSFTYKGFFDLEKAEKEEKQWAGYDTEIGQVSAYSTLGYFHDPILSGMLTLPDGKLASLIMHEMTHSTVFIKDQHEFNENLANFVGDYGASRFLEQRFGKNSRPYQSYQEGKIFRERYIQHFNRGKNTLDSLYGTFTPKQTNSIKDTLKYSLIRKILTTSDSLYTNLPNIRKRTWDLNELPNNAFFVGFSTYNSRRNEFEAEFKTQFRGDFKKYLNYLKQKYPSL